MTRSCCRAWSERQIWVTVVGVPGYPGIPTTGDNHRVHELSRQDARRVALRAQLLTADRPTDITVNGTTVDFVKQGLNEAFRFHNPNIKGECGCGESFSV